MSFSRVKRVKKTALPAHSAFNKFPYHLLSPRLYALAERNTTATTLPLPSGGAKTMSK